MKTRLLFLLLTFVSAPFLKAQNYLQPGSKWRINSTGLSMSNPCYYTKEYACEITGDSLILGQTYKKIVHHGIKTEAQMMPNPSTSCAAPETFYLPYALIRQEGLKLFIYNGAQDELLYDFDLEVGDTLPMSYNNYSNDITVVSIGSLQVGNETRKVFNLSQQSEINVLIEGIGHNWGLIGVMQPFEFYETSLECYGINDTTYYPSLGSPCALTIGLEEWEETLYLHAYPNPTDANFFIEIGSLSTIQTVSIYDVYGNSCLVERISVENTGSISLDLSAVLPGIYIVRMMDSSGRIGSVRVVKS